MPTPACHGCQSLARAFFDGLFETTSDRIAWVAAGVAGSSPILADYLNGVNVVSVWIGPPLAAIFVASKTLLVWIQIRKERRKIDDGE